MPLEGLPSTGVVDPIQARVTIFTLVAGFYEEAGFQGHDRLVSSMVPNLGLTVDRL